MICDEAPRMSLKLTEWAAEAESQTELQAEQGRELEHEQ